MSFSYLSPVFISFLFDNVCKFSWGKFLKFVPCNVKSRFAN